MNGFSTEDDSRGHDQVCCLVDDGARCVRPAGNASYNKRIQKTVAQRKLKLNIDDSVRRHISLLALLPDAGLNINYARHIYICEYHKGVIQSVRAKRKRKDSDDDTGSNDQDVDLPEVDLFQLQVNTLRRYKRHYKVQTKQGLNKAQLADTLMRHFKSIPVVEKEALTFFIYMVKNNKSKFDQKISGGGGSGTCSFMDPLSL